jgi:hypothetical protein
MRLPGVQGLRVPARFWMMAIFCLAVFAGLATAELLRRVRPAWRAAIVTALVTVLLADGWVSAFPMMSVPDRVRNRAALRSMLAVEIPLGSTEGDAQATFDAVTGGWTTVNGYSGFEPAHYWALRAASRDRNPVFFDLVRSYGDVQIIDTATSRQYRLTRRPDRNAVPAPGPALDVDYISATCQQSLVWAMLDRNRTTRWECGPQVEDQSFTVHLTQPATVGSVVHALGPYPSDFPRHLVMDTSPDGQSWEPAWNGDVLREVEGTGRLDPREMRVMLAFTPRVARQLRLRQIGRAKEYWSVTRIEVRGVS